jgi:hypothetical protein
MLTGIHSGALIFGSPYPHSPSAFASTSVYLFVLAYFFVRVEPDAWA